MGDIGQMKTCTRQKVTSTVGANHPKTVNKKQDSHSNNMIKIPNFFSPYFTTYSINEIQPCNKKTWHINCNISLKHIFTIKHHT